MAVDDVPANLKILQKMLDGVGYRTTFATGGQQVLDRLNDIQPDLILLDLMMPGMSGIDVCDRLQQNSATAHIPIIFLTASHEIEYLAQAFECGAVDYVTKPFNAVELLARIRTHLELRQLRKQAQFQLGGRQFFDRSCRMFTPLFICTIFYTTPSRPFSNC